MATAEITILPIGREGASIGDLLVEIARHLGKQDRVGFQMHAMGTSLEGEAADIFSLAAEIHALPFQQGIPRVYTILKLDQRVDAEQTLKSKLASVNDRI